MAYGLEYAGSSGAAAVGTYQAWATREQPSDP